MKPRAKPVGLRTKITAKEIRGARTKRGKEEGEGEGGEAASKWITEAKQKHRVLLQREEVRCPIKDYVRSANGWVQVSYRPRPVSPVIQWFHVIHTQTLTSQGCSAIEM